MSDTTLQGYNCHLDPEHLEDGHVGEEDISSVLEFCEHFDVELPGNIITMLKSAKGDADVHSAIHEALDWLLTDGLNGGSPAMVDMIKLMGGKEKVKEMLSKVRTQCKR